MPYLDEVPDPNGPPPRVNGAEVIGHFAGHTWAAYFGNPHVIEGTFQLLTHDWFSEAQAVDRGEISLRPAWEYLQGAPGGALGPIVGYAACVWLMVEEVQGPPAAKRSWADLSERTKQGYRGKMRHGLGIGREGWNGRRYQDPAQKATAERQFAAYYASATDLRFLRRHPPKASANITSSHRWSPISHGGSGWAWASTWKAK